MNVTGLEESKEKKLSRSLGDEREVHLDRKEYEMSFSETQNVVTHQS